MYTSFFGFRENPFNLTPDPRYLFLSRYHKEALDHLLYGINERKGFIVITGGIGTGKTTLSRTLMGHLEKTTKTALIFNAYVSDMELLQMINQEFGIEIDQKTETKKAYVDALNDFLLENFGEGGNAVLLIDEAQNLSHNVLEQIRMLSNLETEREKLIQIILVGQSELRQLLDRPSLRQLNDRVMVRYDLKPLDFKDLKGYVEHRMIVAGGRGQLKIASNAYKEIYAFSKGNPRRINAVCDRSLLIAYTKEKHAVSRDMVKKAIMEIRGDARRDTGRAGWSMSRVALRALLLLLLIAAVGFGGWRYRAQILQFIPAKEEVKAAKIVPIQNAAPGLEDPKKGAKTPYLDESESLAGLFRLFHAKGGEKGNTFYGDQVGLFSIDMNPEYYVMFKKPFRVLLSNPKETPSTGNQYLLISEVTEQGAIAVDGKGQKWPIARDFILKHWGKRVSWTCPYKSKNMMLTKGMEDPDIYEIQKVLDQIGYLVEATGIYDDSTSHEIWRFQKDFGLMTDGIVGPQTRALLFQMAAE